MEPGDSRPRMKAIARESLTELAYSRMRESIISGRFQAGEQIVETRVSDELGISRSPIREALRRLVEEGLVTERPRHGMFVRELTAKDFVDVYNARLAIESAAVRLVTRHQPSLKGVGHTVQQMREAADRGDADRVVNLELSVHEQLCELSGNEILSGLFKSLSALIRMALAVDDAFYEDLHDVVSEHPPLLDAIASGDEDRAAAAIEAHITASLTPVIRRLGADSADLLVPPSLDAARAASR